MSMNPLRELRSIAPVLLLLTGVGAGAAMATDSIPAPVGQETVAARAMASCPLDTTWEQIKKNHAVPAWLKNSTFGIQIHFGLYSVPAYHNEWYSRHMYCNSSIRKWHTDKYGKDFGYKDFIPMFAKNFDAVAWAKLFKESGASWVEISAEHHDRFALWGSSLTKWNSADMGPKRDIVGELAAAVRAQGMKFGVSNHRMYAYSFQWCGDNADKTVDLYDPKYADLYGDMAGGPPNGGCDINVGNCKANQPVQAWLNDWKARSQELVDKYQVDIQWFDWDGANGSNAMKSKLQFASYYYQQACLQGKQVTIAGKGGVFPGDDNATDGANIMVHDFEKGGKAPAKGSEPKSFWMVDDMIGSTWGYTEGMTYRSANSILSQIKDYKSRGGMLLLNVSPKGDGTIPVEQQNILKQIGKNFPTTGVGGRVERTANASRIRSMPGGVIVFPGDAVEGEYALLDNLGRTVAKSRLETTRGTWSTGLPAGIYQLVKAGASGSQSVVIHP